MSFPKAVHFSDPDVPSSPMEPFRSQLRTHPEAEKGGDQRGLFDKYHVKARYRMFDLTQQSEVEDLQLVMTDIMYGKKILREEKWSHDKEACTTVTIAWLDLIPKKSKDKDEDEGESKKEDDAAPNFDDM